MDTNEIVVHEIESHHVRVVLGFFAAPSSFSYPSFLCKDWGILPGAPNNSMPISWRRFLCKLVQKIRPARKRAKLRETLPQVHYKQNLGATEGLFQQELLQHMQQPFLVYRLVHPGDIGQKADPRLPQPLATRHQKWHTPG